MILKTADDLLYYIRADLQVFQSKLKPSSKNKYGAWQNEAGVIVSSCLIDELRKRGQAAISDGVAFRYLRPLENTTSCRRTECGSESY